MEFHTEKFIDWAAQLVESENEYIFEKDEWRHYGLRDVKVRLKNNSFDVYIPFDNIWVNIYDIEFGEKLITVLILNGLNKIKEVLSKYELARKIIQNDFDNIYSFEKLNIKSFFNTKEGFKPFIKVWQVDRIETEVLSRIGKDNIIITKTKTTYGICVLDCLIIDPYLKTLLQKDFENEDKDYGFIPQSLKVISYDIFLNKNATEELITKYDALEHYKCLIYNNLRQTNEFDIDIFRKSLSNI